MARAGGRGRGSLAPNQGPRTKNGMITHSKAQTAFVSTPATGLAQPKSARYGKR